MKRFSRIALGFIVIVAAALFVVLFIVGQIFFFYGVILKFVELIFGSLKELDKGLLATVITGTTAIIVAVITVVISKQIESKRIDLREKRPIYNEFLESFLRFTNKDTSLSLQDLNTKFFPKLIAYGSTQVAEAWSTFYDRSMSHSVTQDDVNRLIQAIGYDLGHGSTKFKKIVFTDKS
jgi:hypothetical protein